MILPYIFFISCFIVFFNYAGYALIAYALNLLKRNALKAKPPTDYSPSVSFIVAAYNEEDCIETKIINSLQQEYPADKIEYIFITDGSTDGTNEHIKSYPAIHLLFTPERKGKTAALNRAVEAARNEILIFSDANTVLNAQATRNITRHYANPVTGGVAGEKKVLPSSDEKNDVGSGEGLYWKYESTLKRIDSDFYSVVGAAGELFSLRRALYEPVSDQVILDDFIISMKVAQKGYRIQYEPDAYAMELPSFSLTDEKKRKIRIAAGGFQAMGMLESPFRFWKQPKLSFLYISHRILRWTLSPLCLILAFISNLILAIQTHSLVYEALIIAQLAFYGMAFASKILPGVKPFRLAYYFVFMNISVIQGFFRFLRGKQSAAWEKARRTQTIISSDTI